MLTVWRNTCKNVITRGIELIPEDVKETTVNPKWSPKLAVQIDESTDIAGVARNR